MWGRARKTTAHTISATTPQAAPPARAQFAFWHHVASADSPAPEYTPEHSLSSLYCQHFEAGVDALLKQHPAFAPAIVQAPSFEINCRLRRLQEGDTPSALTVGLRIDEYSASSARFALAIFSADEPKPLASGHVVRIFIDTHTGKPARLDTQALDWLARYRLPPHP